MRGKERVFCRAMIMRASEGVISGRSASLRPLLSVKV